MFPRVIFSDFDGTLTEHTEFSPVFFEILSFLKQQHRPLVIVTGRSLSWAHFLMTHFSSLDYIIAEGGGVLLQRDERQVMRHHTLVTQNDLDRLSQCEQYIRHHFPDVILSADSFGRQTDRALELVPLQERPKTFEKICEYLRSSGVHYATSNVHLNFWSGEMSKCKAMIALLEQFYPTVALHQTLFFGDSLNDETVFQSFPHTVGVSNISHVIDRLQYKPSVILEGKENSGPAGVLRYLKALAAGLGR